MHPDPIALSRGQRLALTAASFLLIAVATMALGPLISGGGWWWMCAFVAAGTLFGGAGLRAIRTPASLVPVLELVILVLLLTLLFGGATSFALIVPTTGTFTDSATCSAVPSAPSSSSRCPPSPCRRSRSRSRSAWGCSRSASTSSCRRCACPRSPRRRRWCRSSSRDSSSRPVPRRRRWCSPPRPTCCCCASTCGCDAVPASRPATKATMPPR